MYIYQIMSNNFGYIDIILLGMIAGFIILRLRNILGRKTGHEPKIYPSFAPGYYEKGNGKDLGSVLEFKSEIKLGFDISESSEIGFSYSHISNNTWGDINPGADNQHLTFSKNF